MQRKVVNSHLPDLIPDGQKSLFMLVLIALLTACGHQPVFYGFQSAPDKGWSRTDTLVFSPEISDSGKTYSVFAEVRCFSSYAYEHLGLKYSYAPTQGKVMLQDTVFFWFREGDGSWTKDGLAGLRFFTIPLRPLSAPETGKYDIKIVQNQTDSLLGGIFDVGIKILPAESH